MDPMMQRLLAAQEFAQTLLSLHDLPVKASRAQIQAAIDAANARLKAIAAEESAPAVPLVAPQFAPPVPAASK